MSSTAAAQASASPEGIPTREEARPGDGGCTGLFLIGVPALERGSGRWSGSTGSGLPYSQDWIFLWIVGLMLAFSVAEGHKCRGASSGDWLPIIGALLAYDLLRGIADGKLLPIHWQSPVTADQILGFGQIPTIRLQDALYTPGHLHLWDYAALELLVLTLLRDNAAGGGWDLALPLPVVPPASPPASWPSRRWAWSPTCCSRPPRPGSRQIMASSTTPTGSTTPW